MATVTLSAATPPLLRHNPHASRMSPIPRLLHRRSLPSLAAAVRQDAAVWTQAHLSRVIPASSDESLFHVTVDVSDTPDLAASHTAAGQYSASRGIPTLRSSRSHPPPSLASARGEYEFLVKRLAGSAAEVLCGLKDGDVVEVGAVMGRGFDTDRISPADAVSTVLIFATGSGISPIRSLIESGFCANKRSDVRLYYGARNLERMAYQDRFDDRESTGVRIIPVLSQPGDVWKGECGYVQAAFSRAKCILNPLSTGAVLCGHKLMTEEITTALVGDGVLQEKILKNF